MERIVQLTPEYYHWDTVVNILLYLCISRLILFFLYLTPKCLSKHLLKLNTFLYKCHTWGRKTIFSLYSSFSSCPFLPGFLQPVFNQSLCITFDCCFSHFLHTTFVPTFTLALWHWFLEEWGHLSCRMFPHTGFVWLFPCGVYLVSLGHCVTWKGWV